MLCFSAQTGERGRWRGRGRGRERGREGGGEGEGEGGEEGGGEGGGQERRERERERGRGKEGRGKGGKINGASHSTTKIEPYRWYVESLSVECPYSPELEEPADSSVQPVEPEGQREEKEDHHDRIHTGREGGREEV